MEEYVTRDELEGYVTTDQLWSHQRQLATELQGYANRPVEVSLAVSPVLESAFVVLVAAIAALLLARAGLLLVRAVRGLME